MCSSVPRPVNLDWHQRNVDNRTPATLNDVVSGEPYLIKFADGSEDMLGDELYGSRSEIFWKARGT